ALARPHERLDEAAPDRRAAVDGGVARDPELVSPRLDIGALFGVDATRVGEYRVHGPTALLQIRHAKARVETAREGEDDGFRGFGADDGELGGHGGFPMD